MGFSKIVVSVMNFPPATADSEAVLWEPMGPAPAFRIPAHSKLISLNDSSHYSNGWHYFHGNRSMVGENALVIDMKAQAQAQGLSVRPSTTTYLRVFPSAPPTAPRRKGLGGRR